MAVTYYRLVHAITGYTIGRYLSYSAAEYEKNLLDDWTMWTVEPFIE